MQRTVFPGRGPKYLQPFLCDCGEPAEPAARLLAARKRGCAVRGLACPCGTRRFRLQLYTAPAFPGWYRDALATCTSFLGPPVDFPDPRSVEYLRATCAACGWTVEIPRDCKSWPRGRPGPPPLSSDHSCVSCERRRQLVVVAFEYPALRVPPGGEANWAAHGIDDDALFGLAAAAVCCACSRAEMVLDLEAG